MAKRSMFVGMDVHKGSIDVSAEGDDTARSGSTGDPWAVPTRGYQQRQPSLERGAATRWT